MDSEASILNSHPSYAQYFKIIASGSKIQHLKHLKLIIMTTYLAFFVGSVSQDYVKDLFRILHNLS